MADSNLKMKILCIDDDATGLVIRKMMLEGEGYQVITASSGQAGLDALASSQVDAVILDFQMPSMNGAEVARTIRQQWPDLPVVMLSGFPDEVPEDALKLVNAFVVKGGAPEQLLVVIQDTLAGRSFGRVTILNVDDNENHRYAISRVLRKAGFNVLEAKSGREALEVASARPSLIILDINLPDMLGFDVCRLLKSDPSTRDIPVVHISATYPSSTVNMESKESGAGHFIRHPENLHEVVEVVQNELRRAGRL